jgi:guanylate kinase
MTVEIECRGLMLVLSSPSGAGKTTLTRLLLESDPKVRMSVSATTRPRRPNEVEGRDYFFKSEAEFAAMVERGEFLEHAVVFANSYGTPKAPVFAALAAGRDVLFDIDWQGTQQLKQQARDDVVGIFVLPPSRAELERRLKSRAADPPEVIAKRMAKADGEISHWAEYDYVVVNDEVALAEAKVATILRAERLKRMRQPGLPGFVETLMRGD